MLALFFKKNGVIAPAYQRKPFFRPAEMHFHACLRSELPDCHIFAHIALSALIAPASDDPRQLRAQQAALQGRTVDYAIFDAAFTLILAIELAAPGADASDPAASAACLRSAGVTCLRWSLQQLPSSEQIRRYLAPYSSRGGAADAAARSAWPAPPRAHDRALSCVAIDELAPLGHIKTAYPHIWERICLFCRDPVHLEKYLSSLSIQNRDDKRCGLAPGAIIEITAIQSANQRLLPATADACWNTPSLLR